MDQDHGLRITIKRWWSARRLRTKLLIIVGVLLVLMGFGMDKPRSEDEMLAAYDAPRSASTLSPSAALERDVRKNLRDQYGAKSVVDVSCDTQYSCDASVRAGAFRDADDLAREMGGGLHELFRDTDADTLRLQMLSDTVDNLGNENTDDNVGFVLMTRAEWAKLDWDSLQYMEPLDGLREVGTVAVTVRL